MDFFAQKQGDFLLRNKIGQQYGLRGLLERNQLESRGLYFGKDWREVI